MVCFYFFGGVTYLVYLLSFGRGWERYGRGEKSGEIIGIRRV